MTSPQPDCHPQASQPWSTVLASLMLFRFSHGLLPAQSVKDMNVVQDGPALRQLLERALREAAPVPINSLQPGSTAHSKTECKCSSYSTPPCPAACAVGEG